MFPISRPDTPVSNLEGVLQFPDLSPYNLTARITLNHDEYTTYSRTDGSFIIYNVKPGIHQLDVHDLNFHFSQVKVQLLEESMESPKCLEYVYLGSKKQSIPYPLVLTAHASYQYFEVRKVSRQQGQKESSYACYIFLLKSPMPSAVSLFDRVFLCSAFSKIQCF